MPAAKIRRVGSTQSIEEAAFTTRGGDSTRQKAAKSSRVLVIEDDADIRAAVAEVLSGEGYVVAEAADGIEGLRSAREVRPDVMLLDLMMPGMNGWEFLVVRRNDPRLAGIPVVITSACPSERLYGIGAAAHLQKPYELADLLAVVGVCAARQAPGVSVREVPHQQ